MNKITLFFLAVFSILIFSENTFADTGGNCPTDITSEFPTEADWRGADIIKGIDGSAWKRASITSPAEFLEVKEAEATNINGVAAIFRPVQIIIFGPETDDSGEMRKPNYGNCLDGGYSDAGGYFSFPINARMVWGGLDEQIALDAYYKMDVSWAMIEEDRRKRSAQNFFIGSSMPPKMLTIKGEEIAGEENCSVLCSDSGTIRALSLDSGKISAELLGNNLSAIENKKVTVGRLPGPHTFYIDVDGEPSDPEKWDILQRILHKSLGMEITKRVLLANENTNGVAPGLTELSASQLIEAEKGEGTYSARTEDLVQNIKKILISRDFDEREDAAQKIDYIVGSAEEQSFFRASLVREALIPDVSTEETWADDFVELMRFWSGKTIQNECLIQDDAEMWRNFVESNSEMGGEVCNLMFINGQSPRILLRSEEEVELTPDFKNTKIVHSERPFDADESWILPAGRKKALYYRYDFTTPFSTDYSKASCISRNTLTEYIESISQAYDLTPSEKETLATELKNEIPEHDFSFSLRLANPEKMGERFQWRGNGKPLDLLHLFFQIQDSPCIPHITPLSSVNENKNRDGFEVGILQ